MPSFRAFVAAMVFSSLASAASYPVLTYSTYLRDSFTPNAITTDAAGNIYLGGKAVIDPANSTTGAMVVKLDPQAGRYLYVSFLNGQNQQVINAIAADAQGNAYVAGTYVQPDGTTQAFAAKLDPAGNTVFSTTLGGGVPATASAIAVTPSGEVLVSGASLKSGFPSTPGAFSVADTANHPWLVKLNAPGTQVAFSATGIGGSAIALDSAGDIFVAGTTMQLDYPTTAGVYQPTLPAFYACTGFLCQIAAQGMNQYVSKIDPTGSKLIYSTALSGSGTGTTNTGLAVDSSGDAYLTGYAGHGYPYTVTAPPIALLMPLAPVTFAGLPFLSKLDPAGTTLLFSVPVGGSGVQVDPTGKVYAGGSIGYGVIGSTYSIDGSVLPALSGVPSGCLPNNEFSANGGYVSQVDGASGNVLGTKFLGGSSLTLSGVALSGSVLWTAGATGDPNVPFTPNSITPSNGYYWPTGLQDGAYLGAVDFSQPLPPAGTPQIACVVDSADFAPVGAAARSQLVTILGSNLGPAPGVAASDSSTTSLGGVQVRFKVLDAPLLYVSATQVNLAVPFVSSQATFSPFQISTSGATSEVRALPLVHASPSLFLNLLMSPPGSAGVSVYAALALNADSSLNSASNPAPLGSTISVFLNGVPAPAVDTAPVELFGEGVTVTGMEAATPFVDKVQLQLPMTLTNNFACAASPGKVCNLGFSLYYFYAGGTLSLSPVASGREFGIWVTR